MSFYRQCDNCGKQTRPHYGSGFGYDWFDGLHFHLEIADTNKQWGRIDLCSQACLLAFIQEGKLNEYLRECHLTSAPPAQSTPALDSERAPTGEQRLQAQEKKAVCNTAMHILQEEGKALYYMELYKRIIQRSVRIGGENPPKNLIAHMSLDKRRFKNVGKGIWDLASRYAKQSLMQP